MSSSPSQPPAPGAAPLPQFVESASPRVVVDGVDERLINLAHTLGALSMGIFGVPCIITSGRDSLHVQGSKHSSGQAIDIRTNDKTPEAVALLLHILHYIGESYHVACFDESQVTSAPHIHLEVW